MANKSTVPGSLRRIVFRKNDYTCVYCGIKGFEKAFDRGGFGFYTAIDGVYLSIDHIFPKSAGGDNQKSNLQVLCTVCNTKKGRKINEAHA